MEFALVAKQRGHDVTLYEKEERLGGQVNLVAASPGKKEFLNVVKSLKNRMEISGVRIKSQNHFDFEDGRRRTPRCISCGLRCQAH